MQQLLEKVAMANNSAAAKALQVLHEPKNNRFIIDFENGEKALLEYKFIGEKEVDFYHTEVPPSQQGKGIAAILAGGAFEHACTNNLRVRPSCSYLRDNFVPRNPQYRKCCL